MRNLLLFFILTLLISCHCTQRSAGVFYSDIGLMYKNKTFGYVNTFIALNSPDSTFNFRKYYKLRRGEILDYILKNRFYGYYIVGVSSVGHRTDLSSYTSGMITKHQFGLDRLDSIYHSKRYDTIYKIDRYEVYTKQESINKDVFNQKYTVLFRKNDTIHKMIFVDDSTGILVAERYKAKSKSVSSNSIGSRYTLEYSKFSSAPLKVQPFEIDSTRLDDKKYIQSKVKQARQYLIFFEEQLANDTKGNVLSFIEQYGEKLSTLP